MLLKIITPPGVEDSALTHLVVAGGEINQVEPGPN